jgi:ubiquinone/menaquinone biosynthesis C-methylase UbiE
VSRAAHHGRYRERVNRIHNLICSSGWWRSRVEHELVPWGIAGVDLGDRVLEIGPGFGATTRLLATQFAHLDVLELDAHYCERLRSDLGDRVAVTQGDATRMPYPDGGFTAVLSFTMLHHIPTRELQDATFAEVARVLAPGGAFAGTDSIGTGVLFKLIHIGDTLLPLDPDGLPDRLVAAGLTDPAVGRDDGSFRFRARKPSG